ncbi:MAG: phospholipid carrier-dependent glycosyltransferase [Thermoleophilia bacterium]
MPAFMTANDSRSRRRAVLVAVALVLLLSAGLRFWDLGKPTALIFDEVYYAKDAQAILRGQLGPQPGPYPWEPGKEISWPHPEWGKLAIAAGMVLFGQNSYGRRTAAALAGLLLLACIYPIARRLGLRPGWALAALILAAADPLGLTQSRIATLDIFIAFWTVLAIYLTLRYVQDGHRARWLWLAGLAAGFAFGTKWSGALVIPPALALVVLFRRRDQGDSPPHANRLSNAGRLALRAVAPVAAFVIVPAAIYVASYVFYFAAGHTWVQWWEMQHQMWTFNWGLKAPHTYASAAPTWIFILRPVWYYFQSINGQYHGIVAIGNPLLWWPSIACLLALPLVAIRRRQWLPALPTLLVVFLYLPWFAASRTSFLYYMTPVAPFLAVAVAATLALLSGEYDGATAGLTWSAAPLLTLDHGADGGHAENALRRHDKVTNAVIGTTASNSSLNGDSGLRRAVLVPAALLIAGAIVTIVVWEPVATGLGNLFRHLAAGTAHQLAWLAIAAASAAGLSAIVIFSQATRPRPALRAGAWLYVGIVVGIFVIFLPVIIDLGISPAHYYHLMWSARWI